MHNFYGLRAMVCNAFCFQPLISLFSASLDNKIPNKLLEPKSLTQALLKRIVKVGQLRK